MNVPTLAIWECSKCGRKPLYAHLQNEQAAIACTWCELVYCSACIHSPACAECRSREGGRKVA